MEILGATGNRDANNVHNFGYNYRTGVLQRKYGGRVWQTVDTNELFKGQGHCGNSPVE